MAGYALVSAKGSPGVTTAAAALAGAARKQAASLLAELDPAGGSVQMLARGDAGGGGIVDVANRLRRGETGKAIIECASRLPAGMSTLIGPAAGTSAESAIKSGGTDWMPSLGGCAAVAVADAGRWGPTQRTAERIAAADLVVVVCRPTLESVEHTRHVLEPLGERSRSPVAVLVVGARPYAPEEVASHLDIPLVGSLAWDPRGAANLWAGGVTAVWRRSRLARSAGYVLEGMVAVAGVDVGRPTGRRAFVMGSGQVSSNGKASSRDRTGGG